MAYPYLPVNPCCTDVVLNSPCGCSSTITNSGCNTNNPCSTSITASSTIVYNGPALTCTTAEPCDTLNVILQKIDEIICNLLTQINILTVQVTNITGQITTINNNITNINNQLSVCCVTTTSTTTIHPCENFSLNNTGINSVAVITTDCSTGELVAVILEPGATNICVITDSPLIVPGTVIVTPNGPCFPPTTSTTSTSSTSSTTTTTTTAIPCECLTFTNTSNSIVDYNISYNNCVGELIETTISANEIIKVCGCCGFADNPLVTISIGVNCIEGFCPTTTTTSSTSSTTTTTTTTTYPYPCSCVHVVISQTDLDDATGNTPSPGKADNTVYLTTTKNSGCDESNIDTEYTVAGLSGFCIKTSSLSTIQLFYYKNDIPIYFPATASTYNILYASCSVSGECIPM